MSDNFSDLRPPSGAQNTWTLAIDLNGGQMFGDRNSTVGAVHQKQELDKLAAQTKNNPVALVVQVTEPPPPRKSGDTSPRQQATVERYVIKNGEIQQLGNPVQSRGYSNDVEDLLKSATQNSPSDHLGLIVQSHGGGAAGLDGNSGGITLPEFESSVRNGLAQSGHDKLDFLDFDACEMGTSTVADRMSSVARQLVASSELEYSDNNASYDGQNLQAAIGGLLAKPNMTPEQLAKSFIDLSDLGANDGVNSTTHRPETGTKTLAHYDLNVEGDFNDNLNNFGRQLTRAMKNPAEANVITAAIQSSPVVPEDGISLASHPIETRDFASMVNVLIAAQADGKLNDPQLAASANQVLAAYRKLVPEYHGSADGGYNTQGGMSTFLPDQRILDINSPNGATNGPLNQLVFVTQDQQNMDSKEKTEIGSEIDALNGLVGANHELEMAKLRADYEQFKRANTDQDVGKALSTLHNDVVALQGTQFENDYVRAVDAQNRDSEYAEQQLQDAPVWQAFLNSLKRAAT